MSGMILIEVGNGHTLTEYRDADAELLAAALNNERIYRNTLRIPFPYTVSDAEGFLEMVGKNAAPNQPITQLAIRDPRGRLIGGFGFDDLIVEHSSEIGYWLAESHWGKGLMTSVIGAACRHAERHWGLVRITAGVFDFNLASARVLEKNGFRREGIQRNRYRKDGMFIDSIAYARIVS